MVQRHAIAEANRKQSIAVVGGKHSQSSVKRAIFIPPTIRISPKYSARDIEVLLDALWAMFTETQAAKLRVIPPWDDSLEPETMTISQIAAILESWLT